MTNTIYPEIHTANVAATSIEPGMTTIEPTVDAATGVKSLAYQDEDGNVRKVLTTESMTDANATALIGGGETALHSHAELKNNLVRHDGFFTTAVGDSNLLGELTSSPWTFEFTELSGYNVKNFSIGGNTTQGLIDNQLQFAIDSGAKCCVVMGGTNDVSRPASYTIENLDYIYRQLQNNGITVVAVGVLPGTGGISQATRLEVNDAIENELTCDYYVPVDVFDDGTGLIKTEYKFNDLHINAAGQELLGQMIHLANPISTIGNDIFRVLEPDNICDNNLIPVDPSTWTIKNDVTLTLGAVAPDETSTAYSFIAGTNDDKHFIRQDVSGADDAGVRYDGAWIKGGASTFFKMFNNETSSLATIVFNIATGATYEVTDVDDYGIIPGTGQTDDWMFCWMKSSSDTPDDKIIMYASRDADMSDYQGDGVTPEMYIWNPFKSDSMRGVYDAYVSACDVESVADDAKTIQSITVSEDVPTLDGVKSWLLKLIYYWNYLLYWRDISQSNWTKTNATISNQDGIIASTTLSAKHAVEQYNAMELDKQYTITGKFRAGNQDYVSIRLPTAVLSFFAVNLTTGELVSSPVIVDNYKIINEGRDQYRISLDFVSDTSLTKSVQVYADTNGTQGSYSGDGSTVSTYATDLELRDGSVADNFPSLPTTTAAASAPAYSYKELPEGVSGTFTSVTVEDGIVVSGT